MVGGLWMVKLGINRALWLFGVVQLVSIFGFAWLAWIGRHEAVGALQLAQLALVIGFEALGVGLGTAAFVAFIARATHPLVHGNAVRAVHQPRRAAAHLHQRHHRLSDRADSAGSASSCSAPCWPCRACCCCCALRPGIRRRAA
jgi:hypothetical protein